MKILYQRQAKSVVTPFPPLMYPLSKNASFRNILPRSILRLVAHICAATALLFVAVKYTVGDRELYVSRSATVSDAWHLRIASISGDPVLSYYSFQIPNAFSGKRLSVGISRPDTDSWMSFGKRLTTPVYVRSVEDKKSRAVTIFDIGVSKFILLAISLFTYAVQFCLVRKNARLGFPITTSQTNDLQLAPKEDVI